MTSIFKDSFKTVNVDMVDSVEVTEQPESLESYTNDTSCACISDDNNEILIKYDPLIHNNLGALYRNTRLVS